MDGKHYRMNQRFPEKQQAGGKESRVENRRGFMILYRGDERTTSSGAVCPGGETAGKICQNLAWRGLT